MRASLEIARLQGLFNGKHVRIQPLQVAAHCRRVLPEVIGVETNARGLVASTRDYGQFAPVAVRVAREFYLVVAKSHLPVLFRLTLIDGKLRIAQYGGIAKRTG